MAALRVAVLLALVAAAAAQSGTQTIAGRSAPADLGARTSSGYPSGVTIDLAVNYYPAQPIDQVMVSPSSVDGSGYWIIWHTNKTTPSWVWLGTDGVNFPLSFKGKSARYTYGDYTSALIHKVNVTGLSFGTKYYYRIGKNPAYYGNFTTAPAAGQRVKFAVMADVGTSNNSVVTYSHAAQTGGAAILMIGDFSYADGYQPRWDLFGRLYQNMVGNLPFYFTYGNHELEQYFVGYTPSTANQGLQQFQAFVPADARFASSAGATSNAYAPGGVPGNLFHSTNYGNAHLVAINSYFTYSKYTIQWAWLQFDLGNVNRVNTPWVIVMVHEPWYNTFYYHYLEGESMRAKFEPFVRQYGVDIVFQGHVHMYERFDNTYQYRKDPCGPIYVTIGDGGNREGGSATNYGTKNPEVAPPDYQLYNQVSLNQPAISLYREYSYGHGTLDLVNSTWAQWTWYRNKDNVATATDSAWIPNHGPNGVYPPSQCSPASQPSSVTGGGTDLSKYPKYTNYPAGTHPYYSLPPIDNDNSTSWFPIL